MAKKIKVGLDAGHHITTRGKETPIMSNGKKMKEYEFNMAVVKLLKPILERCGFEVLIINPDNYDVPLIIRTNRANHAKVDLYLSVHANAFDSSFSGVNPEGVETYTYPSGESLRIGKIIHKHLIKGTKQIDRGVKNGSHLHVIRETKMPAVLIEAAFMDNPREAQLLISDAFRQEVATELAQALCEAYGYKYVGEEKVQNKPKQSQSEYFQATLNGKEIKAVNVGGYVGLHWSALDRLGIKNYSYKFTDNSTKVTFTINGKITNNTRVYEGNSYIKYSDIRADLNIKKEGDVYHFTTPEYGKQKVEEKKQQEEKKDSQICTDLSHSPIMGKPIVTKKQMAQFQQKHVPDAPEWIAELYYDLGLEEGVRGEVAFAQAILETGYFTYKNSSVTPDMNNFCGMGVTENGAKGNSFPDVKTGVLAQIQHLKAYASTEPLKTELVDPRFKYVQRGISPHVEDLSNKWAMNPNYGADILKIVDKIIQMPDEEIVKNTEIVISVDKEVVMENGKIYIPIRIIASIASIINKQKQVDWNNATRKVLIDGKVVETTKLVGDIGYGEICEVEKLLEIKVTYDKTNKTVKIG